MTETARLSEVPEVAYYYPEPYWVLDEGDQLKTLLLFFDEIAILLPRYMRGREIHADPVLAGPLTERGLLRALEPETFIDQQGTEELSEALVELLTSGGFDDLDRNVHFAELSRSRMGWEADVSLAGMVIEELEARGLARASEDGVSVPLHPVVRTTVLVLLSQLARRIGRRQDLELHPTTSRRPAAQSLVELLSNASLPSAGHVVALDLETVAVNLASVPLDEVLDFRATHGRSYREYARSLRRLLVELGALTETERRQLLLDRQEQLADQAADLRRKARRAWVLPLASFSVGVVGAAWALADQHDLITSLLALTSGVLGSVAADQPKAGAYTYLFEAQRSFARPARS